MIGVKVIIVGSGFSKSAVPEPGFFAGSDPIDTFVKAVQTLHAHKYKQYGDAAAKTKYGNSALLAGVADPGGFPTGSGFARRKQRFGCVSQKISGFRTVE